MRVPDKISSRPWKNDNESTYWSFNKQQKYSLKWEFCQCLMQCSGLGEYYSESPRLDQRTLENVDDSIFRIFSESQICFD